MHNQKTQKGWIDENICMHMHACTTPFCLTTQIVCNSITLLGFPGGSAGKESTCNARDLGSIPGLGRSPGEGNKISWRREYWRVSTPVFWPGEFHGLYIVYEVAKSWTKLSICHFHLSFYIVRLIISP